jgi:tetratricopeptide (TPR) repeat protein
MTPLAPETRGVAAQLLLVAVATALAYSNTLGATFHFDDYSSIVDNPAIRDLGRAWSASGPRWLGELSFALNYRLGGLDVAGYHVANLLIHVGNGLLLFALVATTLQTPRLRNATAGPLVRGYLPLAAALFFALHPVATQAVTYVVQRFASLATLFFLASLLLHARARLALEAERRVGWRAAALLGLSVAAAAAAMKTKEIAFTLPLVAALYEWLFFEGGSRRRFLLLLPCAATALLVPSAHSDRFTDPELLGAETTAIARPAYLLTQTRVVATYLRLVVAPVGQNLDYDFPVSVSLSDTRVLFALAVLAAVMGGATWLLVAARRAGRAPGALAFFGTAWFFTTLAVESSFIPIRDVIYEHRVYLPLAGAAVVLGAAVLEVAGRALRRGSPSLRCAAALLVTAAPLGVATWARNRVWKDDLTLWRDVAAKSPGKPRAHSSLALAHAERGEMQEAIAEFRIALRLQPWNPNALYNLGNAYRLTGDLEDALRLYERAVLVAPGLAMAHNNLGALYQAMGRADDAERELREALRLSPGRRVGHNAPP